MDNFTFNYYKEIFQTALVNNYQIITLKEFFLDEFDSEKKVFINRIDVDIRIERLRDIYKIFTELKIRATIYLRLHAPNYNLLSIGNIRIIQKLKSIGCEIALHTELEDVGEYCNLNKSELLRQEISLFELLINDKIYGTASHGDMTHYNNLNFWSNNKPSDFGLIYEAYDKRLWNNCRYVSDSEWIKWKAYDNGKFLENDRRTPIEHILDDSPPCFHLLTHPESWYAEYIYE